ncbi:MAG: hypothetical protein NT031_07800 [Planctomycetota bacterium]|nr:hypothetical protein [Planctomycetota bacterium]
MYVTAKSEPFQADKPRSITSSCRIDTSSARQASHSLGATAFIADGSVSRSDQISSPSSTAIAAGPKGFSNASASARSAVAASMGRASNFGPNAVRNAAKENPLVSPVTRRCVGRINSPGSVRDTNANITKFVSWFSSIAPAWRRALA